MAKIGTAQIEIKPVINDEALEEITRRIADAVAAGVARGMAPQSLSVDYSTSPFAGRGEPYHPNADSHNQGEPR